jgi:hypothetical protein
MKITKKKKNNIQIHSIICPYLFFFLLVHGVYRVAGGWLFNLTREKDCKNKKKKKKKLLQLLSSVGIGALMSLDPFPI